MDKKGLMAVLTCGDEDFEDYREKADAIREKKYSNVVTYSRNLFLPVTNLCRNSCSYCGFKRGEEEAMIMDGEMIDRALEKGLKEGCKEALFTFGERPEVYKKMRHFLNEEGYENFVDYLHELCGMAMAKGLLPHTNAGILKREEMTLLNEVNVSMGLMLESVSDRLCLEGMPHEHSPGKTPKLRLRMIEDAGRLKIPFTTGLLIGIGESDEEIVDSLISLKKVHERYGHLQEIIIQNFVPKPGTPMEDHVGPSVGKMARVVVASRLVFNHMSIQVPPNLNFGREEIFLKCGANDFGGVSPITLDYVNPESPWPDISYLEKKANGVGLILKERLAIYPEFIKKGWYTERLKSIIEKYANDDGFVREA
ncbi:MAG: 7,8-didemethyl-8-hydroxy-5-deazariboflavin synthase subunit CofG [Candidatus Hydrothermarchaeales archaeon]